MRPGQGKNPLPDQPRHPRGGIPGWHRSRQGQTTVQVGVIYRNCWYASHDNMINPLDCWRLAGPTKARRVVKVHRSGRASTETRPRGDRTDLPGEGRVLQDARPSCPDPCPRSPARRRAQCERTHPRRGNRVLPPFPAARHHAPGKSRPGAQGRRQRGVFGWESDALRAPRRGQADPYLVAGRDARSPGRTRVGRCARPTRRAFLAVLNPGNKRGHPRWLSPGRPYRSTARRRRPFRGAPVPGEGFERLTFSKGQVPQRTLAHHDHWRCK
jgi:hypothetical protein